MINNIQTIKALTQGQDLKKIALPQASKLGEIRTIAKEKAINGLSLAQVNKELVELGAEPYYPSYVVHYPNSPFIKLKSLKK